MSGGCHWIGAVLVGGASRRMGRRKASLAWHDGVTLEGSTLASLRAAGAHEAVRVGACDGPDCVADTRPGEGPLAALEALLRSGRGRTYVVCPCDMPRIDAALLRRLCEAPEGPVAVFAVAGEDRPRPLPMRLTDAATPAVERLLRQGERSLRALVAAVPAVVVHLEAADAEALRDIDTPEEYARALE